MQTICHKTGRHRSTPYRLKIGRKLSRRSYRYFFDDRAKYDLQDEDQFDWCKLFGISFHLLTSHKNSIMVGWRYNLGFDRFEFSAYAHVAGEVVKTGNLYWLDGSGAIDLDIQIIGQTARVTFSDPDDLTREPVVHLVEFPEKLNKWRRFIEAWFGGNEKAPGRLELLGQWLWGGSKLKDAICFDRI